MKEVEAHRRHITRTIEKLSAQRDVITAELQTLVHMLALSESTKRGDRTRSNAKKSSSQHALDLLHGADPKVGVTAADLARRSGQSPLAAGQMLAGLADAGTARRLKRGYYVAGRKS